MEAADVELIAQSLLSFFAQLQNFQHANFVAGCLPGQHHISLHFRMRLRFGDGGIVEEILNCLLLGPTLSMQAGIKHQPDRAPNLRAESTEV